MYISKFVYIDRYIDRYIHVHDCGAHMCTDMHGLTVDVSWYDIRLSPVASHKLIVGSHLEVETVCTAACKERCSPNGGCPVALVIIQ